MCKDKSQQFIINNSGILLVTPERQDFKDNQKDVKSDNLDAKDPSNFKDVFKSDDKVGRLFHNI